MNIENIYSSKNEFDIPDLLLPEIIPTPPGLATPFALWGHVSRKNRFSGTYGFYIDDYKFSGVIKDPVSPLLTGAIGLCELNLSITTELPRAVAIYRIFQKRMVSRCWQAERPGVDIWVDLSVANAYRDLSLIGVPRGWQRYCTTVLETEVNHLNFDLDQAVMHSAGNPYTLLVYGGGKEVKDWCKSKENVIHIMHHRSKQARPGQGTRARLAREALERGF